MSDMDAIVARVMDALLNNRNFGIDYMDRETFTEVYKLSEFVIVFPEEQKVNE